MESENKSFNCSFHCCVLLGCFANCWLISGLCFMIIGFIAVLGGIPTSFGVLWTLMSLIPFMIGCSMWYCYVNKKKDKYRVRIQRSIASVFIGLGILFYVIGLLIIHRPNLQLNIEVQPSPSGVETGQSWPMIVWMVVSIIPIAIGCSCCYCIEKGRKRGCSNRFEANDSKNVPTINTIEKQVALEPHTSITKM